MHRNFISTLAPGLVALASSTAGGQVVHVAEFEDGVNLGNWTYGWWDAGAPMELTPAGGCPGGMLRHQMCCDAFAPSVHTMGPSVFTGDYRALAVGEIRVNVRVFNLDPYLFPLSLRLLTDAGTPDDPSDDFAAFFYGGLDHALPVPDADLASGYWNAITFAVPSQSRTLPLGWSLHPAEPLFGAVPRGADWNVLIEHVTRVSFEYGPQTPYWPVQFWDLAVDNVQIIQAMPAPATADLNQDGLVGGLDLALLLSQWGLCAGCMWPVNPPVGCSADFNHDCFVNGSDLAELLAAWTSSR